MAILLFQRVISADEKLLIALIAMLALNNDRISNQPRPKGARTNTVRYKFAAIQTMNNNMQKI